MMHEGKLATARLPAAFHNAKLTRVEDLRVGDRVYVGGLFYNVPRNVLDGRPTIAFDVAVVTKVCEGGAPTVRACFPGGTQGDVDFRLPDRVFGSRRERPNPNAPLSAHRVGYVVKTAHVALYAVLPKETT